MKAPALFAICLALTGVAHAEKTNFISGPGTYLYLAAGLGLPLLEKQNDHALRTLDSLVLSTAIAELTSHTTNKPRPDGGRFSFPSEHTTAAFSIATMASTYHPEQAIYWFAGAAAIGQSRVQLRRHNWADVIAGAGVGFATSKWELSTPRGILVSPWIEPSARTYGVQIQARF